MTPLDSLFGSLELFAGAAVPLSYIARDTIVSEAVHGNYERIHAIIEENRQAQALYLAELFGLSPDHPAEQVWDKLRAARAVKIGLPEDTPLAAVLAEELIGSRSALRLSDLRRARDQRLGTYVPLRNDGQW
jgi:hypothetical protein